MEETGSLLCLVGKSGSGKDTVFRRLLERYPRLHAVVTYTTRPRRGGETEGVEYHFVTPNAFQEYEAAGKLIEKRSYHTVQGVWEYGTVDDGSIDLRRGSYLLIATLEGLEGLRHRFGAAVVPLCLEVEDGERLERLLARERRQAQPDYCELCRRFLADETDFSAVCLQKAGIETVFPNDGLDACMSRIEAYFDEKNAR